MSRIRKRLLRFLRNPIDAKWDELVAILRHYGCTVVKGYGSSHWVVYYDKRPDLPKITVPVHNNRIKPVYAYRLEKDLLEEILAEED